ncbi:hypothetical protein [Emticicia sp. C21]|uniref:hypothetical protein n=1 Tax=Emticicia sp. C21 TaxID=2302915 RepID=UPI000E355B93|nr:hypothetical protein [Emticicia sp. C21]RFS15101.1 hypothetical protein D0T08_18675 [Emticicia sp. C21]
MTLLKIISGILILITAFLSFKHGWDGLSMKSETNEMVAALGISKPVILTISILSLAVGALVLFPQTFFIGNVLNAMLIVLIMALSLKTGNLKTALIEIPFLLMPLVMIYLGYPLKK